MTDRELQQITMDIAEALDADTEIYWDGMHTTSWEESGDTLGDYLLYATGILIVGLFFCFMVMGI